MLSQRLGSVLKVFSKLNDSVIASSSFNFAIRWGKFCKVKKKSLANSKAVKERQDTKPRQFPFIKDTDPWVISIGYNASRFRLVLNRHKKSLPTLGDNQKSFEHLAWLWAKLINSAEPRGHLCARTSGSAQLAMLTHSASCWHKPQAELIPAAFTTAWTGKRHHIQSFAFKPRLQSWGHSYPFFCIIHPTKNILEPVFDSNVNILIWTQRFSPKSDEKCCNESLTKPTHLVFALNYAVLQQLFLLKIRNLWICTRLLKQSSIFIQVLPWNASSTLWRAHLTGLGGGAEKGMMRLTRCLQWVELPGFYPVLRCRVFESPYVWSLTQKWHLYRQRGMGL